MFSVLFSAASTVSRTMPDLQGALFEYLLSPRVFLTFPVLIAILHDIFTGLLQPSSNSSPSVKFQTPIIPYYLK